MKRTIILLIVVLFALPCGFLLAEGKQEVTSGGKKMVTLEVWDQFTSEHDVAAIEQLTSNFEEKNPNVKIERTAMPAGEIGDLLRPALQSGTGPDVIYSEVGIGFVGPILKAEGLMDLTDEWEIRGWDDKLFPMAKEIPTVAGVTYGVGHELEFVPLYYNKNIFSGLGLEEPSTIAEFEAVMNQLKAGDYIPLAWGGRDWWPQSNLTTSVLWTWLGQEKAQKGMYAGGSWDFPETEEAIRTVFVDWNKKGYFPKDAGAISYDDELMLFYQQKAGINPTGNWIIGGYIQNIGDSFDVGSFLWPVPRKGMDHNTVSFAGSGYIVNAATEHPTAAVDYIDYLMATEEAARVWYEVASTVPPLKKELPGLNVHPLVQETLDALTKQDVQVTAGLSMAAPPEVMTFLKTSAVQVMTGQITPAEWVDEFERLWDEARKEGITKDTFTF